MGDGNRKAAAFLAISPFRACPSWPFLFDGGESSWDGVVYENDEQAQQIMEGYAKNGFEVQKFDEEGQFLVYSRRVADAASKC
jgi:hypothetical protein